MAGLKIIAMCASAAFILGNAVWAVLEDDPVIWRLHLIIALLAFLLAWVVMLTLK